MTKIQELKALLEAGSSDLCFYSDQVWPEIIGSWRMTGAFGLYKKLQTGDVASTVDYQDDHTGLIVHVNTQDMLNSCVSQGDDYQAVWGKITKPGKVLLKEFGDTKEFSFKDLNDLRSALDDSLDRKSVV
jgi:hypothetical protein